MGMGTGLTLHCNDWLRRCGGRMQEGRVQYQVWRWRPVHTAAKPRFGPGRDADLCRHRAGVRNFVADEVGRVLGLADCVRSRALESCQRSVENRLFK